MVYHPSISQMYKAGFKYGLPAVGTYGQYLQRSRQMLNTRQGDSIVMTEKKRKRRPGKPSFKKMVFGVMGARHDTGEQAFALLHNSLYTLNLTSRILQGDTNATRDGDSIILCGLKIKGFYNTDTASNAYGFRIIVGYSSEEYNNPTFSSGLGLTEVFLPNTGNITTTQGQINPKAFTVLYDEKLTANSQLTGVRDRVDVAFTVNFNDKLFNYQSAGSALGKDHNLYVVVVADILNGVTGTTNVGGATLTWDFVYKNAN